MNNKVLKRMLLGAGVALSLLFAFNVKTHVVNASGFADRFTDVVKQAATVGDDDPAPLEDNDDITTVDDDDDNNEENTNNDEEETTTQAEEGEAVANGVKITSATNDNEKNTVNYMEAADDEQIEKNASNQAKTLAKHPGAIKNEPMTDYTLSDYNHCWVPYWYWYTIINNQTASSMPKKHPTNVKTSKQNVKKYQKYIAKKAGHKAVVFVIITGIGIVSFIVFAGVMIHRFA